VRAGSLTCEAPFFELFFKVMNAQDPELNLGLLLRRHDMSSIREPFTPGSAGTDAIQ